MHANTTPVCTRSESAFYMATGRKKDPARQNLVSLRSPPNSRTRLMYVQHTYVFKRVVPIIPFDTAQDETNIGLAILPSLQIASPIAY